MLAARKQKVLQILVNEYIHTPVAVSSETVSQKMPVAVSSATIRNDISALEEYGYVTRPHASAGCVPSDKGYRAYVECLGDVEEPAPQVRNHIWGRFMRAQMDIEAWSRMAAQLLAGLMRTMALTTAPRAAETRWKHMNLVHVQEFVALLIIVLEGSRIAQQLLPLKVGTNQDQLTQISNRLNASFGGLSRQEIRSSSVPLTPFEDEVTGVALHLLKGDQDEGVPLHYVDGLRHMFSYPELSVGSRPREIAELLEDQRLLRPLLMKLPDAGAVRVTIGIENKSDLLRPFSLVFAQYGVPSKAVGLVGIVGPTRMEYATAISNVRYLSLVMSEMVGGARHGIS